MNFYTEQQSWQLIFDAMHIFTAEYLENNNEKKIHGYIYRLDKGTSAQS